VPVAAKMAFPSAGATGVVDGSPSPTGASVLAWNSTSKQLDERIDRYYRINRDARASTRTDAG
jgi:hypothetical protein